MKNADALWAEVAGQERLASLNWELAEAYLHDAETALRDVAERLETASKLIHEIETKNMPTF